MDPLLFGHNTDDGVVAVNPAGDSKMIIYHRRTDVVDSETVDFYPFFYLADGHYLEGFEAKHWLKELSGTNYYRYLVACTKWSDIWEAMRFVLRNAARELHAPLKTYSDTDLIHFIPDPATQFLMQSGRTLFKGMEFSDILRMQIDIETYSLSGFSNAAREEDRIILIALADSTGWEYLINGKKLSEQEMLNELITIIRNRNPDILEGHNIFGFDLPYIMRRCDLHHIEFGVGRDGSVPRSFAPRGIQSEREGEPSGYEIHGRHIIDTMHLVQSYDASKRVMESYSLKYAAQFFGFASPDRIYLRGNRISWYWDHDPEIVMKYAQDDIRETRMLSEHLSQTIFHLAQMVPANYGQLARLGSAAKIEMLLLREYLRQRCSVPLRREGSQTSGGYTDILVTGVIGPIVYADVESLYPSIMTTMNIAPSTDVLGVFSTILRDLTARRLDLKRQMKECEDHKCRSLIDAMQSSMKILINSFYGYLGYSKGLFNDFTQADRVTTTGQEILRSAMSAIRSRDGRVVEVDTDGIYFVPPFGMKGEETERDFVAEISGLLPEGIHLVFEGRYKKMLSYKKKNYALLRYDNKVEISGSSLISRGMERFARNYVSQAIDCLLQNNIGALHTLYTTLRHDIIEHKLDIHDFARTEQIRDSLEEYKRNIEVGKRNRTAAYELALASDGKYRKGDRISYYITGTDPAPRGFEHSKLAEEWIPSSPDENTAYYLRRLDELSEKFEVFFMPADYQAIFTAEDLFGFSPDTIVIMTKDIISPADDHESPDPQIWLAEE